MSSGSVFFARFFTYCFATGNRLVLAAVLVCALLTTQWGLHRHVVEHSSQQALTVTAAEPTASYKINAPATHDGPSCLICLEHQAHGSALTGAFTLILAQTVSVLMARALPPNAPYLAPERARQRAPPVFS